MEALCSQCWKGTVASAGKGKGILPGDGDVISLCPPKFWISKLLILKGFPQTGGRKTKEVQKRAKKVETELLIAFP